MRLLLSERERYGVFFFWSVLLHIGLVALVLLAIQTFPPVMKQGEPLFVEFPKPDERSAPAGRPSPTPKVVTPPQVKSPAPSVQAPKPSVPRALPQTPPAEPRVLAKAEPVPKAEPAPKEEPSPPKPSTEAPAPENSPLLAGDKRYALVPKPDLAPPLPGEGEGGLGGRGGEGLGGPDGEPVPLDTPDPRYADYFEILRKKIRAKWLIPTDVWQEGRARNSMVIMTLAKDGRLAGIALRYASGAPGFDQAALTAIKLAAPFPPVPDSLSKGRLPISVGFALIIISDVRGMLLQ